MSDNDKTIDELIEGIGKNLKEVERKIRGLVADIDKAQNEMRYPNASPLLQKIRGTIMTLDSLEGEEKCPIPK